MIFDEDDKFPLLPSTPGVKERPIRSAMLAWWVMG
jgi:hypothetical protein